MQSAPKLRVLLIGNYANDRQESMQRFAGLLAGTLPDHGVAVSTVRAQPVFGRFQRGASGLGKWLGYLDKFLLFPVRLRHHLRGLGTDSMVHVCDHANAIYTRHLGGIPHLVTCHDLLAIRAASGEFVGQTPRSPGRLYQRWIRHGLGRAAHVACVSAATRDDLLRLATLQPQQVSVIYNGLNHSYSPWPRAVADRRLRELSSRLLTREQAGRLRNPFILHVGGNQWYKNRLGVLQIFAQISRQALRPPGLVMVGKPFTADMRRFIADQQLGGRVVELKNVSNEDLNALYCCAELLLFPSFQEGFGWPIVEAHACGCRVVTTGRAPMSEIGGHAAAYVDLPASSAACGASDWQRAAAEVMTLLLETADQKADRVKRGLDNAERFTSGKMVRRYLAAYEAILSRSFPAPVPLASFRGADPGPGAARLRKPAGVSGTP